MRSRVFALATILQLLPLAAPAQATAPPTQDPASPQRRALAPPPAWPATTVNPDGTITFRLKYPTATKVTVATDALLQPLTMTQDADGVWTATTPSLAPEYYGYTFVVDGVKILDPLNRYTHVNFVDLYSDILVPGTPPEPWELADIPHGDVTRHLFTTHIGLHYPDNQTCLRGLHAARVRRKAERRLPRAVSVARFFRHRRWLDADRPGESDAGPDAGRRQDSAHDCCHAARLR
jgi:hypothetical protein